MKKQISKFTITLLLLTAITGVMFIGCNDDEDLVKKRTVKSFIVYDSHCKNSSLKGVDDRANVLNIAMNGDTCFFNKSNWKYGCHLTDCPYDIKISYDKDTVFISENYYLEDTGFSKCDCNRDLNFYSIGIPEGKYIVKNVITEEHHCSNFTDFDVDTWKETVIGDTTFIYQIIDTIFSIDIKYNK